MLQSRWSTDDYVDLQKGTWTDPRDGLDLAKNKDMRDARAAPR